MVQGLRVLAEKAVDLSLIPGTHVVGMQNGLQKVICGICRHTPTSKHTML